MTTTLKQVLSSVALGFIVMLLQWWYINSHYHFALESKFLKLSSLMRSAFFSQNNIEEDVWFINAGSSVALVEQPAQFTQDVVVDRSKLDTLLRLLEEYPNPQRVILCDLLFDTVSESDTSLAASLRADSSVYWPLQPESTPEILKSAVNAEHTGFVDYEITSGWKWLSDEMGKFPLVRDGGEKSLVLKFYEGYTGNTAKFVGGLLWINGKAFSKNIVVDESLRSYSLHKHETFARIEPIGLAIQTLSDKDDFARQYASKKYILIGNFDKDIHHTVIGEAAGPVINFNLYLSLLYEENRVRLPWVLLVFTGLTAIFHIVLFGKMPFWLQNARHFLKKWFGSIGEKLFSYSLLVWIVSLISYFIYQTSIPVVGTVIFIGLVLFLRQVLQNCFLLYKGTYATSSTWEKIYFIFLNKPVT